MSLTSPSTRHIRPCRITLFPATDFPQLAAGGRAQVPVTTSDFAEACGERRPLFEFPCYFPCSRENPAFFARGKPNG